MSGQTCTFATSSGLYLMCVLTAYWRSSEASETLSGVYKFELVRYVYIYICTMKSKICIVVSNNSRCDQIMMTNIKFQQLI